MPFCDGCEKYWTPTSMHDDGTCPSCGTAVETVGGAEALTEEADKVPWHFKLMVVALVVYLGWRFFELGVDLFS